MGNKIKFAQSVKICYFFIYTLFESVLLIPVIFLFIFGFQPKENTVIKRLIALFVCVTFIASYYQPVYAQDFSINQLPVPGTMVSVSPRFEPALIRGLTVHKDNPFLFDFIVDPGQSKMPKAVLKDESERMIKYFFAALTIPDHDIWVNLSPYEKDRMIPVSLGQTAMGRDLLAQDYMLKQL